MFILSVIMETTEISHEHRLPEKVSTDSLQTTIRILQERLSAIKAILDSDPKRMEGLTHAASHISDIDAAIRKTISHILSVPELSDEALNTITNLALQRRPVAPDTDMNTVLIQGSRGRRMKVPENASLFAQYVRTFRKRQGWTQDDLAQQIGSNVTKQYVSKVEAGHIAIPHHNFLQAFSAQCHVGINDLLTMTQKTTK